MTDRAPGFYWVRRDADPPVIGEWTIGGNGDMGWWLVGDPVRKSGVVVLSARLVPPEAGS